MKYLFFLLLLANIVFYLWETGLGQSQPKLAQTDATDALERIVLVEELPPARRLEASAQEVPVPPAGQGTESPPPVTPTTPASPLLGQATDSGEATPPTEPGQAQPAPVAPPAQTTAAAETAVQSGRIPAIEAGQAQAPTPAILPAQTSATAETPSQASGIPPAPTATAAPGQTPPTDTSTQSAGTPPTEPGQAPACHQLGPYLSLRQAQAALAALSPPSHGEVKPVKKPTLAENGYLILYPAADSLEAAQANRKMLVAKGHADAWVIDKGENRYAISLAVVNGKERADEAVGRFRAEGIIVELRPRMALVNRWWLEAHDDADRAALDAIAGHADAGAVAVKSCD